MELYKNFTLTDPKCNRDKQIQNYDSILSEMGTEWTLTRINGFPKSISGPAMGQMETLKKYFGDPNKKGPHSLNWISFIIDLHCFLIKKSQIMFN